VARRRSPALCLGVAALGLACRAAAGPPPAWPDLGGAAVGWDFIDEDTGAVSADPDLVRWGVTSRRIRYYTRLRDGRLESCGVEIWRFADDERARLAHRGFEYPDWQIERAGRVLLMLHGQAREQGRATVRGVGPDCAAIGRAVRASIEQP